MRETEWGGHASRDHATVDGQEEFVARLGGSPHLVSYWRLGSPPFISQEVWPFGRGPTTQKIGDSVPPRSLSIRRKAAVQVFKR